MTDLISPPRVWTSADLAARQQEDPLHRYEIIAGELFMSPSAHKIHQRTCSQIMRVLDDWSQAAGAGEVVEALTVRLSPVDEVIPDVMWVSPARVDELTTPAGHYEGAPDLIIEVLSPGGTNLRRDREAKLGLYSRYGVREYWIVTWQLCEVDVYRYDGAQLVLAATLGAGDTLTSPLLPGFTSAVEALFPPELRRPDPGA